MGSSDLSVGTIHRTPIEAGTVVAPVEDELRRVLASTLLHADETPWPEHDQTLWLWVFRSLTVTLYYASPGAARNRWKTCWRASPAGLRAIAGAHRHYPRRLRCWAHLIRKARGLVQSGDREARVLACSS
ncbi:MAG: transposase [Candidatus Competibacteraceae bacterium]